MPFLSIFVSTCRPEKIRGLLANLKENASEAGSFELLINIDEGDHECARAIAESSAGAGFRCIVQEHAKDDGYYSLHRAYNALIPRMSEESRLAWLINDELRIETHGFDALLRRHAEALENEWPDGVFRMNASVNKWRSHRTLAECFAHPENYAIYTRAWLDAAGGWGEIWGPDSWHQAIAFFLGRCRNAYVPGKGVFRSAPFELILRDEAAGRGLTQAISDTRKKRIKALYRSLTALAWQEKFFRHAQALNLAIFRYYDEREHGPCTPEERARRFTLRRVETGETVAEFPYAPLPLRLREGFRRLRTRLHPALILADIRYLAALPFTRRRMT